MRFRVFLLMLILSFPVFRLTAQEDIIIDSLEQNLVLLKRYLSKGSNWHFTDPTAEKQLSGLISFIEHEPIDTLIKYMSKRSTDEDFRFVFRLPENAPDSLLVPGYIPFDYVLKRNASIFANVEKEITGRPITVPGELLDNMEREINLVPEGQGMQLFNDGVFTMPDSLKMLDAIPENMVQSPDDFRKILRLEESRRHLVEQKRLQYNDSLIEAYRARVAREYRRHLINQQAQFLQVRLADSVRVNNYQVLKQHNEIVAEAVNDSLKQAVLWMANYANLIDNTSVNLVNLTDASSPLILSNAGNFFTRVWLKNRQNDSISILVQNIDKRSMRLVIEDGLYFHTFQTAGS
jgi:hypothetical protein